MPATTAENFPAWMRPTVFLYVFVQEGCEACAVAKPHFVELRRRHPTRILVTELNLTRMPSWNRRGWQPNGTPGYSLEVGEEQQTHTGILTLPQLERWIGKDLLS